jgi:signal transduction histidine kinase/ligand-binding sensor domain-containing protein
MRRLLCISTLWLLAVTASPLLAATPDIPLRQFEHTAWTLKNGAPSQILALAQTMDGYLWIGTANGLFRFDGVSFQLYQPPRGQHLMESSVQSLTATPDGGLWVGYTLGGTSFLKNGVVQNYETKVPRGGGTIWSIVVDTDGSVWAASLNGVLHFFSGSWHDVETNSGFDAKSSYLAYLDSNGTLWVSTDDYLYRKLRGSNHFEKTGIKSDSGAVIQEAPDGTLWMSDEHGLFAFPDQPAKDGKSHHIFITKNSPADIRFDDSGALWILTTEKGISRIQHPNDALKLGSEESQKRFEHYTVREGLTSDRAIASLKDREGNIWIGGPAGLDQFRTTVLSPGPFPTTFANYGLANDDDGSLLIGTQRDGLQRLVAGKVSKISGVKLNEIGCLYRGADGKLWLGGIGDLGYLDRGRFVVVPVPANIKYPGRSTQAMTYGPGGELWMQNVSSSPILRLHGKEWLPIPQIPHTGPAVTLMTDHTGRVWAGFMKGIIAIFETQKISVLRSVDGLTVGNVTALYESGNQVWAGGELGVDVFRNDKPVPMQFAGNTSIGGISGIIRLDDGTMWLNSLAGVLRIPKQEIDNFLRDPNYAVTYRLFNYLDGIAAKPPQLRPLPSIIKGADEKLWFTTTNGASSIDPKNIYTNPVVPPVSIVSVIADGHPRDFGNSAPLPKGMQNLEIDYTALSLSIPERVFFRYKLEGYDKDWQDAGTRRQAFYSHLPPGKYVFRVIACNNDGLWNETGVALPIGLSPTFLQSWYFKGLIAFLFVTMLWALYLLRVKQATERVRERIYERFSERERIARDLHDTFFQGIQGLLLSFQSASRKLPADDATRTLMEESLTQSDQVMLQGRELLLDLRTPSTAIDWFGVDLEASAVDFARLFPAEFHLIVIGSVVALNPQVSEDLYRLGREALNNAFRHARASRIEAEINYGSRELRVNIRDNGTGISQYIQDAGKISNHWGLPGMKERAAKIGADFTISSCPETGTDIKVTLPSKLAYRDETGHNRWHFISVLFSHGSGGR